MEKKKVSGLCDVLKARTKEIHQKADKTVVLYSVVALSDRKIYRQLLKDFYFVFKTLEEEWERARPNTLILQQVYDPIILRTKPLEDDLRFYYEDNTPLSSLTPSKIAQEYCNQMKRDAEEDPRFIFVYIYHLYMAILAGGQTIRGWCKKSMSLSDKGTALYEFDYPSNFTSLRSYSNAFREKLNAVEMEEDLIEKMVDMSVDIFNRNNQIIMTLDGYKNTLQRWSLYLISAAVLFGVILYTYYRS